MRALALAALLLPVVGCGPSEPATDAATDTAPAPDSSAASAAPADEGLPAALSGLNLQANHASGSVLRVTGVRFAADHIAVDLEFTNGASFEQKLNQYSNNHMVLRDNLGNVYNVSAPANNGDVTVPAGQNIAGEFVFLGRINPGATALTLVTNEEYGDGDEAARDPKMTIQIPFS